MPVAVAAPVILQALLTIPVIRTGSLLVAPHHSDGTPGCIAYLFVEILPGSRAEQQARKKVQGLVRKLQPHRELRRRTEERAICGGVENRVALAVECLLAGMKDEAVQAYKGCVQGAHADDIGSHLRAGARLLPPRPVCQSAEDVAALVRTGFRVSRQRSEIADWPCAEGLRDTEAALKEYQAVKPVYVGLEARCRYGLPLKQLRRLQEAGHVFDELLVHARRFAINPETGQDWITLAKQNIAENGRW